jgi:hypothetical protein
MEYGTPHVYPTHKMQVNRRVRLTFYYIEYGLVEYGDRACGICALKPYPGALATIHTSDTGNGQWLGTKYREYESSHKRCKEHFRDTILLSGLYQIE